MMRFSFGSRLSLQLNQQLAQLVLSRNEVCFLYSPSQPGTHRMVDLLQPTSLKPCPVVGTESSADATSFRRDSEVLPNVTSMLLNNRMIFLPDSILTETRKELNCKFYIN
ncbi:hypothetical protein LshimejAT787_0603520 [Lyophyllum shimeji]|uniref:Uncharacterized protein n=1 Tax=Lyophyllum shimeji TaxID=47721 RepID=A0A9P3UPN1_LYOSH|nr:hypothetical protein LshimejAT787_0603520 [Lyophyllum shimeji]